MKYFITIFFFIFNIVGIVEAQNVTSQETLIAEDLIVLRDGKVIRAKVLEIGLETVKYKKSDYLSGPAYHLSLNLIYAINYPNGNSEYFISADSAQFLLNNPNIKKTKKNKSTFIQNPQMSLGLGFIRVYAKGDELLSNLQQKNFLPSIFFRYNTQRSENLRVGIELGLASYRFEGDEFSSYDQVVISGNAKENIFSMNAFGRYTVGTNTIRPYLMGGLGLVISTISNELTIVPIGGDNLGYQVNSGTQNTQLSLLMRAGAEYTVNEKIKVYGDLGIGLSAVQVGVIFN